MRKLRPQSAATFNSLYSKSTFSKKLKCANQTNLETSRIRQNQIKFIKNLNIQTRGEGLKCGTYSKQKEEYEVSLYTTKAKIMKEIKNLNLSPKNPPQATEVHSTKTTARRSNRLYHPRNSAKNSNLRNRTKDD